jgi:hypothetical protein
MFSCFDGDKQGEYFLKKLFSLTNDVEFEKAVTSIIIAKSSNTFLSPNMWNQLGTRQDVLENERNEKRQFDKLPAKPFMSALNFFDEEFATQLY